MGGMARGRGQRHTAKPGDLREHSWATKVQVRQLTAEELEQRRLERKNPPKTNGR